MNKHQNNNQKQNQKNNKGFLNTITNTVFGPPADPVPQENQSMVNAVMKTVFGESATNKKNNAQTNNTKTNNTKTNNARPNKTKPNNSKRPNKNDFMKKLQNKSAENVEIAQTMKKLKTVIEGLIARQEKIEQSDEPPPFVKLKTIETTLKKMLKIFNEFLEIMESRNKPPMKKERYKELVKLIDTFETQVNDFNKSIPRNSHGRFVHVNHSAPKPEPYVKKPPYLGKTPWKNKKTVNYSKNTNPKNGPNRRENYKKSNINNKKPKTEIDEVLGI